VTDRVLADDRLLSQFYSVPMFDPELIRSLRLIPTEYLFFYYSQRRALANQLAHRSTRGEEIGRLNDELFGQLRALLAAGNSESALAAYIKYLNVRSGSYMALESSSADLSSRGVELREDPFRAASGYHRIALDVMRALRGDEYQRVIVNVRNHGAIDGIRADDVVEVPCNIGKNSIIPEPCGTLPAEVRGLVLAVKEYERATIEAAMSGSSLMARKAMLLYPAIGEWEPSEGLLRDLEYKRDVPEIDL
jgi:6-phospho-beta-glucosidase